jgi:adenylosuccinate synthase
MSNIVLIGAQWGDEGKGKIIDFLAEENDLVIRYQGGNNAGHTVVVGDQKYVLRLIPSGILHPGKICLIGNGVVLDPGALLGEIESLEKLHVSVQETLRIADNAHVIMPYHQILDQIKEKNLGANKIGTTGKGIGPCYADKVKRTGIRMHDLCSTDPNTFLEKLERNCLEYNPIFLEHGFPALDPKIIFSQYIQYGKQLRHFLVNPVYFLEAQRKLKKKMLFEGAQGTALDVDFGTYPFVTSSNPSVGGVCTGAGIGATKIDRVIGVAKAYTTRVGSGPFPSEMDEAMADRTRKAGNEFGSVTGRPRRCGWLDMVQLKYVILVNGLDALVLTKIDVLDTFKTIKIVTAYSKNGIKTEEFPSDITYFNEFQFFTEELPGWQTDTTHVTCFADFPGNAKKYLNRIAELSGLPIEIVSVGAKRSQTFKMDRHLGISKNRSERPECKTFRSDQCHSEGAEEPQCI